jgi:1,4-dihydroxy-6-naphthoate synthase
MKSFSIGISPCPNDTYIFGALVNGWLENSPVISECIYEDVEFLNNAALTSEFDVIKISYFAYARISENYQLLTAGGALGKNCGPLLVSKKPDSLPASDAVIAIPGFNTTANMLLSMALPESLNKKQMLFSDIEEAVLSGEADFGLIIHESRFTYKNKGLFKVMDLGEFWESKTHTPLPLGTIAVRRALPFEDKQRINEAVKESIIYANCHAERILEFAKNYAQEMDDEVMRAHINLYVNEYSLDLGLSGKNAVRLLFEEILKKHPDKKYVQPVFFDD